MTLIGLAWIIRHVNQFPVFIEQLFKTNPFFMGMGGFMGNFKLVPRFLGIKVQESTSDQYFLEYTEKL